MSARLRVLCLDIEGGHGGSSRSLYEIVRHMDREAVAVEVWCRRHGAVVERYAALGVPCRVMPAMPKVSSLPRLSRNLHAYARFAAEWTRSRPFRRSLTERLADGIDVVHLNHEALFLLGRWLRRHTRTPLVQHVRTNIYDSPFADWQSRVLARTADRLVFITENERATLERRVGRAVDGTVIYNPVAIPAAPPAPHPAVPADGRLRIACLSNYSWTRGLDRMADVALALRDMDRRDILFVVAGDMHLTRSLPGDLGRLARRGGTLADYMARRGVADMFLFLGHVDEPERVLAACHALIKPTRENNPWGRDILEALAAGRPPMSVGAYETFVEDGVTGILQPRFDARALAARIAALACDRDLLARMGEAGRARVARLCHGPSRAADLLAVWQAVADR